MHHPIPPEIMHNLQCWSEKEVKLKRRLMEHLTEPTNTTQKEKKKATTQPQSNTGVRTRYSLAKGREDLNLNFLGTQTQVDYKH